MSEATSGSVAPALTLAGNPATGPRGYLSWAACQGARDPYYILVVIYIFYPYFSNVVVADPVRGQALLGYTNSIAGFALALLAPILGAVADKSGRRKPWIGWSTVFMVAGASALWLTLPAGAGLGVYPTLGLLIAISIAFAISEIFHNAMLASTAPANKVGLISGLAFSFGNVGGLSLMLFALYAFSLPGSVDWSFIPTQPLFGIDQATHEPDRIVGPMAAAWMLVFTLPLLLFTPDGAQARGGQRFAATLRSGLGELRDTLREVRAYGNVVLYLLARMLFFDGMVGVMTFGGVYASGTFDWGSIELLIFGLTTSFTAMIGAWLGGLVDDAIGSKRALQIAIAMSALLLVALVSIQPDSIGFFYSVEADNAVWSAPYFQTLPELVYLCTNQCFALFFVTGLSASRTLMAKLAPPDKITQFFGLYALSGTVTAFLAPLMVGSFTDAFNSQRAGFASLTLLMVLGSVLLFFVRDQTNAKSE
ncbi:MAG: MFS transporter [Pseudomonadota bacterium]